MSIEVTAEMDVAIQTGDRPEDALELAKAAGLDGRFVYKLKTEDFDVIVQNRCGEWTIAEVIHHGEEAEDAEDESSEETESGGEKTEEKA